MQLCFVQGNKLHFVCNEGNFVAVIRMFAECNSSLKNYLISGTRNARYVSKTIQNEIIAVFADLIRERFRQCLQKCAHFALMADETASHGREFLSVCIRLLDSQGVYSDMYMTGRLGPGIFWDTQKNKYQEKSDPKK